MVSGSTVAFGPSVEIQILSAQTLYTTVKLQKPKSHKLKAPQNPYSALYSSSGDYKLSSQKVLVEPWYIGFRLFRVSALGFWGFQLKF